MSKTTLFNFINGRLPIEVGQKIYVLNCNSRGKLSEVYVLKIGNKLVHASHSMDETRSSRIYSFFIENGIESTPSGQPYSAYSSKEAYHELVDQENTITKVYQRISFSGGPRITYQQAKKILAILGDGNET